MNYIIFGGSGFIGTHLIHLLKNECVKDNDKIYDLDIVMPWRRRGEFQVLLKKMRVLNIFV